MHPGQAFFDRFGNRVCRACNIADEMGAAQQRIVEGELERAGVPAYAIQKDKDVKWCPRCNDLTGAVVSSTHAMSGHEYEGSSRVFGCSRCGARL